MENPRKLKKKLQPTASFLWAHTALSRAIEDFSVSRSPYDETELDLLLRIYLDDNQSIRAHEMCSQVHLSASHVSRTLDALEAKKLIARSPDPEDRRAMQVKLTRKGEVAIKDYIPHLLEVLEAIVYDEFSKEELKTLVKLNRRLAKSAEQFSQKNEV